MTKTNWYPPHIKPTRVGVYQIKDGMFDDDDWYSFWDGLKWCYTTRSVDAAFNERMCKTELRQEQHWRGVTEQTSEATA